MSWAASEPRLWTVHVQWHCVLQVATEGDAFTMAFHDPIDAISWAWDVQQRLLLLPWPQELLTQVDAKEVYSPPFMPVRRLIFKGLRVRMAMHTGKPEATHRSHPQCLFVRLLSLVCLVLFQVPHVIGHAHWQA